MADINLITFDSSTVTPQHDALMANAELTGNGILYGCTVSKTDATTLSVEHGVGVIYGREFEVNSHTITIQKSDSGTLNGQLFIRMNLGDVANPISIVHEEVSGALSSLVDNPSCNTNNQTTEIQLCTFTVDGGGIVEGSVRNTCPGVSLVRDALESIISDASDTRADLTSLAGITLVHVVTGATANLNGPAYRTQGLYYLTTNTNISYAPTGVVDGFLQVYSAGSCVKQIFMRFGTVGSNDHDTYIRTYDTRNGGTWSSWEKLEYELKTEDKTITLNGLSGSGMKYKQVALSGTIKKFISVSIVDWSGLPACGLTPYAYYSGGTYYVGVMASQDINNGSTVTLRAVYR